MKNNELALHIKSMLNEYNQTQSFTNESLDQLLNLADFTTDEIGTLINKFHYINTQIADNGGVPVLKIILDLIEKEKQIEVSGNDYQIGDTLERWVSIYLVDNIYKLSDEYMKENELYSKWRMTLVKLHGENGMERIDGAL